MSNQGTGKPAQGLRVAHYLEASAEITVAALHIQELYRIAGIEAADAIGSYILDRFYGGSIEAWKSRRRNKNNSLDRIAAYLDRPSKATLYRTVCVCIALRTHPCVSSMKHICLLHIVAVATLPPDAQLEWLERASAAGWTVEQLQEQLTSLRRASGDNRGRRPDPALKRAKSAVRRAIGTLERAVESLCALEIEDDSEVQELATAIDALGALVCEQGTAPRSEAHASWAAASASEVKWGETGS